MMRENPVQRIAEARRKPRGSRGCRKRKRRWNNVNTLDADSDQLFLDLILLIVLL